MPTVNGHARTTIRRAPRRVLTVATLIAAVVAASLTAAPAVAAPPAAPQLVSPASGGTLATPDAALAVTATDPDGDPLSVRFVGRKAGATTSQPGSGDPFSVVVIPDTQNYTEGRQATILAQTQWVRDTRAAQNTAFAIQLGDLVSDYTRPIQWTNISNGMAVLDDADVPYTVVPGNHDFNNATGAFAEYDTWFPPSRYTAATWSPATASYGGYLGQNQFGPDPVDRRNMDNYALFSAGGRDFLVLNLEWEAPQYALDWADRVLAAHPDRLVIMATHSFLTTLGNRRSTPQRPGGTSTQKLWTDFVATHCAIKLVVAGHEHNGDFGEAMRRDANSCGGQVTQVLTDYQARANGGDGWLRSYRFDPVANTMSATTYSPTLGRYETDADSQFTVPFEFGSTQPAPFAELGTRSIASGGQAQLSWSGLDPDTVYEWKAISSDGTGSVESPTWTFRTPAATAIADDTFSRTLTGSWGTADSGQSWSLAGSVSTFGVGGGVGRIDVPKGTTRAAQLAAVSVTDALITMDAAVSPLPGGSGLYLSTTARTVGTNAYRAKLQVSSAGVLSLMLIRQIGSTETTLASQRLPGAALAAGEQIRLVTEVSGTSPTTLRAKAWRPGAAEPTAWNVTATDGTAGMQSPGAIGINSYLSSAATANTTVSVDRFTARRPGTVLPPANVAPTAAIGTPSISGRTVTFSGAGSTDPDGTIAAYAWQFGDGATATGATTSRTYAADGTYTVRLTVTDDDGATGTITRAVTVAAAPVNTPPTAAIGTPVISGRTVTLSGSGSTDPDGTIAGYAWDLGDGTTATGATTSRTYAADGTYTVRLTVTDDDGATGTITRAVTVATVPTDPALARDDFARTVANGWGTAPTGGGWTVNGTASRYAVGGGAATQVLAAGVTTEATLRAVSGTSTDVRGTLAFDRGPAGGALYASVIARGVAATSDYRLKVYVGSTGKPQLQLVRKSSGAETTLATVVPAGITITPGARYAVAVRAVPNGGSTVLSAKLWPVGSAEPAGWQVTATEATAALQGAGWAGFAAYNSSGATAPFTLTVDDVVVTAP